MSDLKTCPFCGTTDLIVDKAVIAEYYSKEPKITCKHCDFTIQVENLAIEMSSSPEENADWWDKETAEKWNTRPAEDAKDKEIERLEEALEKIYKISLGNAPDKVKIEFIKTVVYGAVHKNANAPDNNVGKMEEK